MSETFYWEETVIGYFIGSKGVQIPQYKLILYSALTSGPVSKRKREERMKTKQRSAIFRFKRVQMIQTRLILYPALKSGLVSRKKVQFSAIFYWNKQLSAIFTTKRFPHNKPKKKENVISCDLLLKINSVRRFYRFQLLAVSHVQTSSIPGEIMFCLNVWSGFKKKAERKKERTIFWDYWEDTVLGDFTGS